MPKWGAWQLSHSSSFSCFIPGPPTPGRLSGTTRNRATQQEVSGGLARTASSVLQPLPIACIAARVPPPKCQISGGTRFPWECRPCCELPMDRSRLPTPYETWMPDDLILPSDVLYNYFIIYHNVIKMEMKCTVNLVHLNNPQIPPLAPTPPPSPWKNCLLWIQSLLPKSLGTAALDLQRDSQTGCVTYHRIHSKRCLIYVYGSSWACPVAQW